MVENKIIIETKDIFCRQGVLLKVKFNYDIFPGFSLTVQGIFFFFFPKRT